MTNQSGTADSPANLQLIFGSNHSAAKRVLDTIKSDPNRHWRAEDLLNASGTKSMMELLMIVSRLTYLEMIEHPDLGVYTARCDAAPIQRQPGRALRSV